jgi:hypothetical protein
MTQRVRCAADPEQDRVSGRSWPAMPRSRKSPWQFSDSRRSSDDRPSAGMGWPDPGTCGTGWRRVGDDVRTSVSSGLAGGSPCDLSRRRWHMAQTAAHLTRRFQSIVVRPSDESRRDPSMCRERACSRLSTSSPRPAERQPIALEAADLHPPFAWRVRGSTASASGTSIPPSTADRHGARAEQTAFSSGPGTPAHVASPRRPG